MQCQKLDITFNSFIDLEDDEQQIITGICKRKQMNKAFLMELQTNWLSYFLNNSLRNQPNLGLSGPALPAQCFRDVMCLMPDGDSAHFLFSHAYTIMSFISLKLTIKNPIPKVLPSVDFVLLYSFGPEI